MPILLSTSILAKLIMKAAHLEEHSTGPASVLVRTLPRAWIVRGCELAKRIVKECIWCKVRTAVVEQQKIRQRMVKWTNIGVKPFTWISLDFLGLTIVKDMVKSGQSYMSANQLGQCIREFLLITAQHVSLHCIRNRSNLRDSN